jgi:hypothetical protein
VLTGRRSAVDERASLERQLDNLQRCTQVTKVPVVDATVVELMSQLEEQPCPVLSRRGGGYADLKRAFDDPDSRQSRNSRSGLLPRPLPARSRTPLWEPPPRLHLDRLAAPAARGGRTPALACGR